MLKVATPFTFSYWLHVPILEPINESESLRLDQIPPSITPGGIATLNVVLLSTVILSTVILSVVEG